MLQIPPAVHQEIKAHGAASYPYEGCGLLLGQIVGGVNIVTAARPMRNIWPDQEEKRVRFRIDPQEWLAVEFEAAAADQDIIGVFHSHPDHPAEASPRDLAWAGFAGYSYLITEVRDGKAIRSRSWQLNGDRSGFYEEPVEIFENSRQQAGA